MRLVLLRATVQIMGAPEMGSPAIRGNREIAGALAR
jgi:hypothetical protein